MVTSYHVLMKSPNDKVPWILALFSLAGNAFQQWLSHSQAVLQAAQDTQAAERTAVRAAAQEITCAETAQAMFEQFVLALKIAQGG